MFPRHVRHVPRSALPNPLIAAVRTRRASAGGLLACRCRIISFDLGSSLLRLVRGRRRQQKPSRCPAPVYSPRQTHCSFATIFMPSSRGPVTLELMYWRTGAPCTGASAGIVKPGTPGSGCALVARDPVPPSPLAAGVGTFRIGVEVRAGVGDAAALLVCPRPWDTGG